MLELLGGNGDGRIVNSLWLLKCYNSLRVPLVIINGYVNS